MEHNKLDYYINRTIEHIQRVQNNMVLLTTKYRKTLDLSQEDTRKLILIALRHDQSKFHQKQFIPYIELTEYYRQRKTLNNKDYKYPTEEIKQEVDQAVNHHYKVELHHPEGYVGDDIQLFTIFNALDTVCDLQAMAQEFNEGTCRNFYETVWKPKHRDKFEKLQWEGITSIMDKAIQCFEKENNK